MKGLSIENAYDQNELKDKSNKIWTWITRSTTHWWEPNIWEHYPITSSCLWLNFSCKWHLQLKINIIANDKLQTTTSWRQHMKYSFGEYKYGDFILIQGWVPATTFAITLVITMHTNMFIHGWLKMWQVASFGFFKIFCQFCFFNHSIKTTKLCHMAT
jgi:hypothetical protein